MKPARIPVKDPVGKDDESGILKAGVEFQEKFEEEGGRVDVVDGNFVQNPFALKADDEDHTPNFTKAPKGEKIGWNFQAGRGNGGVGL